MKSYTIIIFLFGITHLVHTTDLFVPGGIGFVAVLPDDTTSENPPDTPPINDIGILQDTAAPFDVVPTRDIRLVGWMHHILHDNDKILLAGAYNGLLTIVRYDLAAQRDATFGDNGVVEITALNGAAGYNIEKDDKSNYYIAGDSLVNGVSVFTFASVDTYGDIRFVVQETGLGAGRAFCVVCNPDGTFFVGGQTTIGDIFVPTLIKYTYEGQKVSDFGVNGVMQYPQYGRGYLSNLEVINETTLDASGRTGGYATLMQLHTMPDRIQKMSHGF